MNASTPQDRERRTPLTHDERIGLPPEAVDAGISRIEFRFSLAATDSLKHGVDRLLGRPQFPNGPIHLESSRQVGVSPDGSAYFEVAILHIGPPMGTDEPTAIEVEGIVIARARRDEDDQAGGDSDDGEAYRDIAPAAFLDQLAEWVTDEVQIRIHGALQVAPGHYDLVFPLPIDVQPPIPGFQFNEIRGVILANASSSEDEPIHDIVLDRHPDGHLWAVVNLRAKERPNALLFAAATGHVLRVSGYAINRAPSYGIRNAVPSRD